MEWILFVSATFLTVLLTPVCEKLAFRWNAVDLPDARRIHSKPTPRLGGLAMYFAFWLVILVNLSDNRLIWGLFFGSTLLLAVGVYDDIKGLRAGVKLLWQIAAVCVLFGFGLSVQQLELPVVGSVSLGVWGYLFAMLWIVGLINTVNLSDGMDGLAAGICVMAAFILFWSAHRINQETAALLMLVLAGVALGFLFFNFHPAKIFMGDSGSMFLGYMLGGVSLMGTLKTATLVSLVLPLLVLGVPLIDVVFSIVRRKWKGKPIAKADRGHLHHRLLDVGCSQRQAVLVLYGISLLFGLAVILFANEQWLLASVLIVVNLFTIVKIMFRKFKPGMGLFKKRDKGWEKERG